MPYRLAYHGVLFHELAAHVQHHFQTECPVISRFVRGTPIFDEGYDLDDRIDAGQYAYLQSAQSNQQPPPWNF
jgi:hypothetical protein